MTHTGRMGSPRSTGSKEAANGIPVMAERNNDNLIEEEARTHGGWLYFGVTAPDRLIETRTQGGVGGIVLMR